MAVFEIPLRPATAQTLKVALNDRVYGFSLAYIDEAEGGWTLDIADEAGSPLVAGIALLPGQDLLEPYPDLGIGVRLAVVTPGEQECRPNFDGLGVHSKLLFEPIA